MASRVCCVVSLWRREQKIPPKGRPGHPGAKGLVVRSTVQATSLHKPQTQGFGKIAVLSLGRRWRVSPFCVFLSLDLQKLGATLDGKLMSETELSQGPENKEQSEDPRSLSSIFPTRRLGEEVLGGSCEWRAGEPSDADKPKRCRWQVVSSAPVKVTLLVCAWNRSHQLG